MFPGWVILVANANTVWGEKKIFAIMRCSQRYTIDGGYAEYIVAYEAYCFPLHPMYANAMGAPLMCAGLIGYRSYSMIEIMLRALAFMVLVVQHTF